MQQQQHSFNVMLTCAKKQFTGGLSCSYDRPYRLPGCCEAALMSFTKTEVPVYIMCDLLEYTDVNQNKYPKVNPQIMNFHAQTLAGGVPAEYPFHRIEMDTMTIRENTQGDKKDFLFGGQIPKYVIMVMVANGAMNGDYKKNPYNFKFFNANWIELTKDRQPCPF